MFVCLACCLSYGMTVCLSFRIMKSEHNIVLYNNNEHIVTLAQSDQAQGHSMTIFHLPQCKL